ncbi:TIGR02679 domain-containing protein [Paenibacillus sp. GCM10023250]|uniref:TIGR02679 domain-containing protein n=1 Tax=Paenibacillus sp. GCM10023250 TaxID=3252648 RepID=UPI00361AC7F6
MREEEIRSYFGRPGFERFLKQLAQKYAASKDGARGSITLTNISELERDTLDTFYRLYSPPVLGENRAYSLNTFKRLLAADRFELTVKELLQIMNGEPVLTRGERESLTYEEWKAFVQRSIEAAGAAIASNNSRVLAWAQGLIDESSPGFRTLRTLFAKSQAEARRCLDHCLESLNIVVGRADTKPIRLPILAAQATGDAHALDWKHPLGRLFWWGLTYVTGNSGHLAPTLSEDEFGTEQEQIDVLDEGMSQAWLIREGYRRGSVADDDLSSQVLLYAPELFGVAQEHVLTLRQVERLSVAQLGALNYTRVFMVENPSVFAELVDADSQICKHAEAEGAVIICGNGRPTTAVIKLLDALLSQREDVTLHYAGDLDLVGLGIALSLQIRYRRRFRAWRMDREVYLRYAHKGMSLADTELLRLPELGLGWDASLIETMIEQGVKLHQELWVAELLKDFDEYTKRRVIPNGGSHERGRGHAGT